MIDVAYAQFVQEYQKSTAYHEAAHEIVCIAQKIPIRELGLRIDPKGNGVAHTFRRNAGEPSNTPKDIEEREQSIILLFAGYWGQERIFPDVPSEAVAKDQMQIDELLDEMYSHQSQEWYAAKERLREESRMMISENWPVIDTLAKALWAKPWKDREQLTPFDAGWSSDTVEKSMDAKEVEAIVKPFGLNPIIRPDTAGNYVHPIEENKNDAT
jgi:hypothetical protein